MENGLTPYLAQAAVLKFGANVTAMLQHDAHGTLMQLPLFNFWCVYGGVCLAASALASPGHGGVYLVGEGWEKW